MEIIAGTTTIRDVAHAVGVTIGSVSRVLNRHRSVSPDVRRKVMKEIQKLHYEPGRITESMRVVVTHTIDCAIRDISIPDFGNFVNAAENILRSHGYLGKMSRARQA
jgi:LacI family transcriptional regulator